jgi:hypothetical protein
MSSYPKGQALFYWGGLAEVYTSRTLTVNTKRILAIPRIAKAFGRVCLKRAILCRTMALHNSWFS